VPKEVDILRLEGNAYNVEISQIAYNVVLSTANCVVFVNKDIILIIEPKNVQLVQLVALSVVELTCVKVA